VVPSAISILVDQVLVYLVRIVQVHVEVAHSQLWRPAVFELLEPNIALGLGSVALVDQVKCLQVVLVLFRT